MGFVVWKLARLMEVIVQITTLCPRECGKELWGSRPKSEDEAEAEEDEEQSMSGNNEFMKSALKFRP